MARTGISFDEVSASANALVSEGKKPTIDAIRSRLGTGSPNTIHRFLSAWRDNRPTPSAPPIELPGNILKALAGEIERASAEARAEIQTQLLEAKIESKNLSEAGEVLEIELDRLVELNNQISEELAAEKNKNVEQHWEIGSLREQLERELKNSEITRVELAKAQLELDVLRDREGKNLIEINWWKDQAEQASKAGQEAVNQATNAEKLKEVALARYEAANNQVERLDKQIAKLEESITKASGQLATVSVENGSLKEQIRQMIERSALAQTTPLGENKIVTVPPAKRNSKDKKADTQAAPIDKKTVDLFKSET